MGYSASEDKALVIGIRINQLQAEAKFEDDDVERLTYKEFVPRADNTEPSAEGEVENASFSSSNLVTRPTISANT